MVSRRTTCGKDRSCGPTSPFTLAEVLRVMKTMRRGCWRASELMPASYVAFSLMIVSHRQSAVLLNSPEMPGDESHGDQRQNHAVKNVETQQGVLPDDVAAEQEETNRASESGNVTDDVRPDGDRPEGQLVPGKQIAGVAQKKGDQQQADTDHPVEFVRRLVSAAIENMEHVPEHRHHHRLRRQAVEIAEKDSVRHHVNQILHVAVGVGDGGM